MEVKSCIKKKCITKQHKYYIKTSLRGAGAKSPANGVGPMQAQACLGQCNLYAEVILSAEAGCLCRVVLDYHLKATPEGSLRDPSWFHEAYTI